VSRKLAFAAAFVFACGSGIAVAQDDAPPPDTGTTVDEEPVVEAPEFTWPKFKPLRFEEDWSTLDFDRVPPRDWTDEIKRIELGGDAWLGVGGQARWRYEGFNNFGFGEPADDDDMFYILQRVMLWTDLHVNDNLRFFVEGKSAIVEDRDLGRRRTLDQDTLDVQNAFVQFSASLDELTLTLRGGRQELLFGKQRLVSPLDWANTRRTFDTVTARIAGNGFRVDGFWAQPVEVDKYDFNDWWKGDHDFYGVYATFEQPWEGGPSFDLYVFGQDIDAGDVDRYTVGGRAWGPIGDSSFAYDVEGGFQFGDAADDDIRAYFLATELSYTFATTPWVPKLTFGFDYASGDDDPLDGDVETFNQLFPLGHAYLGYIDTVGRQNIVALRGTVRAKPAGPLWIQGDFHAFWRAEEEDALYNAGGGVVRAGAAGTDEFVGYELDLTAGYSITRHWSALVGYSHFFPGDFIDETGRSDDIDFVYAQLKATF
jgi:hypothetical protein